MKIGEFKTIISCLGKELGWSCPVVLLKCLIGKKKIFSQTRWVNETGVEAAFARRLSISAAIYKELVRRLGKDKAFEVMRSMLVPIGTREQLDNLNKWGVLQKNGMSRLLAFYDGMGKGGVGQFVERTITEKSADVLSFQVRNCFFDRFYQETGTPELTQLFCEVDIEFFSQAFPDFKFHRGDSLENTVAYGKDYCVFTFEKKPRISSDE